MYIVRAWIWDEKIINTFYVFSAVKIHCGAQHANMTMSQNVCTGRTCRNQSCKIIVRKGKLAFLFVCACLDGNRTSRNLKSASLLTITSQMKNSCSRDYPAFHTTWKSLTHFSLTDIYLYCNSLSSLLAAVGPNKSDSGVLNGQEITCKFNGHCNFFWQDVQSSCRNQTQSTFCSQLETWLDTNEMDDRIHGKIHF